MHRDRVVDVAVEVVVELVAAGVGVADDQRVARRRGDAAADAEDLRRRAARRAARATARCGPRARPSRAPGRATTASRARPAVARSMVARATSPRKSARSGVCANACVRVAQRHVDDVLRVDRRRPVGHGHRAGELHQRGEALRVDREHAVDRFGERLAVEVGHHARDRREVGRDVDALPRARRVEARVPVDVVLRRVEHPRRGIAGEVERRHPLELVEVHRAVRRGEDPPVADEPAGPAELRRVLHDEEVAPGLVLPEHEVGDARGFRAVRGVAGGLRQAAVEPVDRRVDLVDEEAGVDACEVVLACPAARATRPRAPAAPRRRSRGARGRRRRGASRGRRSRRVGARRARARRRCARGSGPRGGSSRRRGRRGSAS